jgi:hypothetical protein
MVPVIYGAPYFPQQFLYFLPLPQGQGGISAYFLPFYYKLGKKGFLILG